MPTPTLTRLEIERLPNRRRKTAREWSSSCPFCSGDGGVDRLIHFLDEDEFWCRQCGAWGKVSDGKSDGVDWQRLALADAARRAQAERDSAVALAEVAKLVPTVARYHANLLDKDKRALWYTWGLTDESVDKFRLGYAFSCPTCRVSDSLTIPVYQDNHLISIRHRLLHAPADAGKYRPQFGGLPPALYNLDVLQTHPRYVVLVEGEIKAMVLTQFGFPAVGVPGASTFKPEWVQLFSGQQVVVCFDPGAEEQAKTVRDLLGAFQMTLDCKPDDWFVVHGRSAAEFTERLDQARSATILALPVAPDAASFDTFAWLDQMAEQEKPTVWELLEEQAAEEEAQHQKEPTPIGWTYDGPGAGHKMTREEKLHLCGHLSHTWDPRTGMYRGYYYRCQLRECEKCQEDRARLEKMLVTGIAANQTLYQLTVDPGVEKEILATLQSSQYRRYPISAEETVILHNDPAAGGDKVDVETVDWRRMTSQPEGKKISGKLGKGAAVAPAEKKPEEPSRMIRVPNGFVVDAEGREVGRQADEVRLCAEYAIEATLDLSPTLETLSRCLAERDAKFREYLAVAGYLVKYSIWTWERVRASELRWDESADSIRKMLAVSGKLDEGERVENLRRLRQTGSVAPVLPNRKLSIDSSIPF